MLKDNQIFIHIPKTGGTTLATAFSGSDRPLNPDLNYRHIVSDTQLSNAGDIFNALKNEKYQDYKIFMMLRNPLDRLLSEYYYFRESDRFMSLLKPRPKSFEEYALHAQSANYVISFLLGNKIYVQRRPSKEDFEQVLNGIENLNITIGLFEEFKKSLDLFEREIGVKWPKVIANKRVTIIRPEKENIATSLIRKIEKHHALDYKLYAYAQERFTAYGNLKSQKVEFKTNRFEYVLQYVKNHLLIELVLKDHPFVQKHQAYFNELRKGLLFYKLKRGETYLKFWRIAFVAALKENHGNPLIESFLEKNQESSDIQFLKAFQQVIVSAKPVELQTIKLIFRSQDVPKESFWQSIRAKFY